MDISDYPKPEWAKAQRVNLDGVVVDICECNVEHPNPKWIMDHKDIRFQMHQFHPCCGCCIKDYKKRNKK